MESSFCFSSAYAVETRPQDFFFLYRRNAFVKSQKPLYGVLNLRTADLENKGKTEGDRVIGWDRGSVWRDDFY